MISGEYKALSRSTRKSDRVRAALLSRTALCSALSVGLLASFGTKSAKADPTGTQVISGAVSIQQTGTHTEFTQTTGTAILNHSSFDIKSNESVNFSQPSTNSLAVNRIVGSDISTTIAGQLTATGNVWVINPSGVAISGTAQVNVNGLIATSASISDADILSGNTSFANAPDASAITNAGSITAGDGNIVLVAPIVDNSGTLTANGSDIALGAGSGFTIDSNGDGLTRFEVTPASGVSLTNTGTVSAQGGAAYISAASLDAVQDAVVSIGGKVEATRIEARGGVIVISGGDKGVTEVSGTVSAEQVVGAGGDVAITGELVEIKETAKIDASGATDGGRVLIGADVQGAAIQSPVVRAVAAPASAPIPNAKRTIVREGATITADAGANGDGGKVIVWGDEMASFRGTISAKGGFLTGDGGFAETSAKDYLDFNGGVDLTATNGDIGTLLIDPDNITIEDGIGLVKISFIGFNDFAGTDLSIDADQITNVGADVILQANENITVNEAVNTGDNVTFQAGIDIVINQSLSAQNLTLIADSPNAAISVADGDGTIIFGASGSISGSTVVLSAGEDVALGNATATTSLSLTALGGITQASGTSVASPIVVLDSGADIVMSDLGSAGNEIDLTATAVGSISQESGTAVFGTDVALDAGALITLGDITATTSILADSVGVITQEAGTAISGPSVTLDSEAAVTLGDTTASTQLTVTAGGDITQDAGTSIAAAGNTTLSAGANAITLTEGANDFADLGAGVVDATGGVIQITDTDALSLGTVAGTAITVTSNDIALVTSLTADGGTGAFTLIGGDPAQFIEMNIGIDDPTEYSFDGDELGRLAIGTLNIESNNGEIALYDIPLTNLDLNVTAGTGSVAQQGGTAIDIASMNVISADEYTQDSGSSLTTSGDTVMNLATGILINSLDVANITLNMGEDVSVGTDTTITAGNFIVNQANNGAMTLFGDNTLGNDGISDVTFQVTNTIEIANLQVNTDGSDVTVGDSTNATFQNLSFGTIDVDTVTVTSANAGDVNVDAIEANNLTVDAGTGSVNFVTGASSFAGDLTVTGADAIGQTAAITVSGATALTATNDIVMDVPSDLGTSVSATATNITLNESGGFAIGDINASNDLTITAAGTIEDVAGTAIEVTGTTSLLASDGTGDEFFDIVLDNADTVTGDIHDFGGAVTATGEDILINDVNALVLGTITTNGPADTTEDTTIAGNTGTFTARAGSTITQDSGFNISGNASFTSQDFTDPTAFSDVDLGIVGNTLVGTFSAVGEDIILRENNGTAIEIGSVTANADGTLDTIVSSQGGAGGLALRTDGANDGASGSLTLASSLNISDAGSDFVFDNEDTISIGSLVVGDAANVTLNNDGALALGANGANGVSVTGDVSVSAEGSVTQGGGVSAATLDVTAVDDAGTGFFDVVLEDTANAVTGDISIAAGDISLRNAVTTNLGTITTAAGADTTIDNGNLGDLTVVSDAGIAQSVGTTITGTTDLTAAGDIVLEQAANDFQGAVSASGEDISLVDSNALDLGAITTAAGIDTAIDNGNDGDLTVVAGGTLTDSGTVTVLDATSLQATGDIVLDDAASDYQGTLSISGEDISLRSVGTINLLSVTAAAGADTAIDNGNLGDLILNAGTDITQAAPLTVAGTSDLIAGGNVQLDDAGNDFQGAVSAAGDTVTLQDSDTLTLGTIAANSLSATALGGDIVVGDAIDVTNGDIALTATEDLDIDANITTTTAGAITLQSDSDDTDGGDIDIVGGTSVVAAGLLDLISNGGALVDNGTGTITLTSGDVFEIGNTTIDETDLAITAAGDITDESGATVSIAGNLTLDSGAADVVIDDATTDLADIGSGFAVSATGGNISITADADTTRFGAVTATDATVDLFNNGGIETTATVTAPSTTIRSQGAVTIGGDATASAGDLRIESDVDTAGAEDITLTGGTTLFGSIGVEVDAFGGQIVDAGTGAVAITTGTNDVTLGTLVFDSANLDIDSAGSILQTGDTTWTVSETTDLTAVGDVTLTEANDFGIVSGSGTGVTLNDVSGLVLGSVSADTLTVTTGGAIEDVAGQAISVTGSTSIDASGFDIALDNGATHDFADVTASGGDITLEDANGIVLGAITTAANSDTVIATNGGDLVVTAGGDVTQNAVASIAGTTAINAVGQAVTLDQSNLFTGAVSAAGQDITLTDADALTLGDIDATGTLTATAEAGAIDDAGATVAGNGVDVAGIATLVAGTDITLDDEVNDFATYVDASGVNISLADDNGIILGDIDATGGLTVSADGSISDLGAITPGEGVNVDGTTTLTALDDNGDFQDITLNAEANNFDADAGATADAVDDVDATGANIALRDEDGLALGTISANESGGSTGTLTIEAAGSVTDTAGEAIVVAGDTLIVAADDPNAPADFFDIVLDEAGLHDFNRVDFSGEDIAIEDINDATILASANVDASEDPTLGFGGSISLDVAGALTVESITAVNDIVVSAGDDFTFDQIASTSGEIALTSGGNFVVTGASTTPLIAEGDITLTAANGSFFDPANGRNGLVDGLTFASANGNIILDFAEGFVVQDLTGVGPFTLDAPNGTAVIRVDQGLFAIGSQDFLTQAAQPGFNPFQVQADVNDTLILQVNGQFAMVSDLSASFHIQNTAQVANAGFGTVVTEEAFVGGNFTAISLFGSFANVDDELASVQSFNDANSLGLGLPAFQPNNNNTANGCVILIGGACTPLGSLNLSLDFDDGLFLGITFVDPTEDEDDPFSNRGDEEEWE